MTSRDGPLLAAIAAARADDVGALLDAGASPNAYERPHRALHRAVLRKQLDSADGRDQGAQQLGRRRGCLAHPPPPACAGGPVPSR